MVEIYTRYFKEKYGSNRIVFWLEFSINNGKIQRKLNNIFFPYKLMKFFQKDSMGQPELSLISNFSKNA